MSESGTSNIRIGPRRRFREKDRPPSPDSSEDSPVVPRSSKVKKRYNHVSSDSDSDFKPPRRRRRSIGVTAVVLSDSDEDPQSPEEVNTCPICLGNLNEANLQARPETCLHTFCVDCIIEWSKSNTSCALCRKPFAKINLYLGDEILEEWPVKRIDPGADEEDPMSNIVCLRCLQADQEDTLLLCDLCNDAYHCACLSPPLLSVPPGHWFCPRCCET